MVQEKNLFEQVNDIVNRANPYPFYKDMLKTPIFRQEDGSYIISSYRLIAELYHDPRISSDARHRSPEDKFAQEALAVEKMLPIPFIRLDPPEHDHLRQMVTRQFGPPHSPDMIDQMQDELIQIVNDLINQFQGKNHIDIVNDFSYPFPVTVICRLLGIPVEDESRFHVWANAIVATFDPLPQAVNMHQEGDMKQIYYELSTYMKELIIERIAHPGNDMLSRLAIDHKKNGELSVGDLTSSSILLLIAGHETTVNLISNSMLMLLRRPNLLEQIRNDPTLVTPFVEEILRLDPPIQFSSQRTVIADVTIDGITIPKGSTIYLMQAAGNRDPERFPDPDSLHIDRQDNQHLSFGSGIHYCFGAPLARLETQIAVKALVQRLINPRLVTDPPPYRQNALLRGPRHIAVDIDGIGK